MMEEDPARPAGPSGMARVAAIAWVQDPVLEIPAVEGSIATGSPSGGAGQVGLAPARLCPHCAAPSQTAGEFCPYCGRRFSGGGRSGFSTRVKWALAGLAVLLVLGGAGVAVAIKLHHDDQVAAQHQRAAAAATARAQAARRAAQAAEVSSRQSLETGLQDAITKDATQKANQGLLFSGAPTSTVCTPVSGGSSQDRAKRPERTVAAPSIRPTATGRVAVTAIRGRSTSLPG